MASLQHVDSDSVARGILYFKSLTHSWTSFHFGILHDLTTTKPLSMWDIIPPTRIGFESYGRSQCMSIACHNGMK